MSFAAVVIGALRVNMFSRKCKLIHFVMRKVYSDVDGKNSYTVVYLLILEKIHSIKLVDYLLLQADRSKHNCYADQCKHP